MSNFSLYIKTHNVTGLKYLGYTSRVNVYSYTGSGKAWTKHLAENDANITTEIIFQTSDKSELNAMGRYYSEYYHIMTAVDDFGNRIWANLIPETGGGSGIHNLGKRRTEEQKKRIKDSLPTRLGQDHPMFDESIYTWVNEHTNEITRLNRREFAALTGATLPNICSHLKGDRRSVKNWQAKESANFLKSKKSTARSGSSNSRFDCTEYNFVNSYTNETLTCTRQFLLKTYNLHSGCLCAVVNKQKKSHKGWRIV